MSISNDQGAVISQLSSASLNLDTEERGTICSPVAELTRQTSVVPFPRPVTTEHLMQKYLKVKVTED
jgi:hypothetical protein